MELELTADQEELRDSMRAVLAKESPVALARRVVDDDVPLDALWTTLTGLGWCALTVPESDGGIGLGMIEAGILAEEIGRVIAPGPLLTTVTQFVPAVRETGTAEQRTRFLGAVAAGNCSGALAIAEERGSFDPASVTATVVVDGAHAVLAGEKRFVVEGDAVDELVVVAREPGTSGDDGVHALVVPVAATRTRRVHALDGGRSSSAAALRRAIEEATVATALEIVGAAQTIFDVTLEYAKQREQFGVPIGSFQAIKHKFADMIVSLERARATGYFAALTIAEDDPRRTSATWIRCSRSQTRCGSSRRTRWSC